GGVAQCGEMGEGVLRSLAERLGAPVVTTYAGRGLMAGHRLTIEASTHEPEVEAVLGEADLLLVVGSGLVTDERMVEPVAFVEAVETWPTEGVVVTDMCVPGYWTSSHARHDRPRHLLNPVGWGTLGYALPAAIGPAAAGMPTLAVCGDGGPMFALGELATYAQEKLPIALVIVDDGGYGMLRYDQQVFGHPERGVDLMTPDWRLLAASFGIAYVEVDVLGGPTSAGTGAAGAGAGAAGTLTEALASAAARPGPTMIVLRAAFYPPASTSPRWFETATGPRETA
ncbi:MAG: thiamine pyrophosphate-dependent enzyme, partial [Candidatus Nanopelagicales bacterium]